MRALRNLHNGISVDHGARDCLGEKKNMWYAMILMSQRASSHVILFLAKHPLVGRGILPIALNIRNNEIL